MHEMSIVQGIIELCIEHSGGRRVKSLDVEIGRLSSAVPDAVEFCFDACSRDTLLEGAKLNIIITAGLGSCLECGAMVNLAEIYDSCEECGSHRVTIVTGEELRVREIEVED